MTQTETVYVLKYGSFEGTEVLGIFATHKLAQEYAENQGYTPDDGIGGVWIEEVEIITKLTS